MLTDLIIGVGLVVAFGTTALCTAACRPHTAQKLGRNSWGGIRTMTFMSSDEAWARGHEMAWPAIRVSAALGIAFGVVGVVLFCAGNTEAAGWVGLMGQVMVQSIGTIGAAIWASTKLAKEQR